MMRVPVYIVYAAALVAAVRGSEEESNYYGREIEPNNNGLSTAEHESLGYLIPRLMAKYGPNRQQYLSYYPALSEIESNNIDNALAYSPDGRSKRAGQGYIDSKPSLSISNSLDVLRNRLLLEISRKSAMKGMNRNRDLLCKIGKRSVFDNKRRCNDQLQPEEYVNDSFKY